MSHETPKVPAEIHTYSVLQQQLLRERSTKLLDSALEVAARVEQTAVPDITKYFSYSNMSYSGIDFGAAGSSYVRYEKGMIDNAAQRVGISITEGDTLDDATSEVVWETQENQNGPLLRMRFNDPEGALRKSSEEVRNELNKPFALMAEELRQGATEVISNQSFSLGESGQEDIVFSFMDRTSLSAKNPSFIRAKFVEGLYALPVHLPTEAGGPMQSGEGVYFDEGGNLTKILREVPRNSGIYRGMYFEPNTKVDPTQANFRLGIEIDTERATMERSANADILAEPFLTTETGQALVQVIDNAGLGPSSKLANVLAEQHQGSSDYDKRYGGSYSELSREIAKFINNPVRNLESMFAGDEDQIRQSLESIDASSIDNEPTKVLVSMLQASINRTQADITRSDIPVFEGTISMRDKSCKDAEAYYLGSLDQSSKYSVSEVEGKSMLHKHFGGETSINLEPIVYKCVEIPAGGLFQRHEDEQGNISYAFVRMTSFAFSEHDAKDAFTWQYTETMKNHGGNAKPTIRALYTVLTK